MGSQETLCFHKAGAPFLSEPQAPGMLASPPQPSAIDAGPQTVM